MKIVVDARSLGGGGIGRYLRELTGRWLEDPDVEEIRFLGVPSELDAWLEQRPDRSRARVVEWTDPVQSLRAHLRGMLRWSEWSRGADVALLPHWNTLLPASGPPRLLAVHALTRLRHRETRARWERGLGRVLLGRSVRAARSIVTAAEASRKELERWLPETKARLRVIPNGVSHEAFRPRELREQIRAEAQWSAYRPFLLVAGPIEPDGGVGTALRALGALRGHRPDLRLVHVGPPEVRDREVAKLLQDSHLERRFVREGVLTDARLNEAYAACECLLHGARKEGFGLHPLEAMASGAPVLAAEGAILQEEMGDAALFLDPENPAEWAQAVVELAHDSERRERMIQNGTERARGFSWDRTASETLEALREAVSSDARTSRTISP